MGTKLHNGTFTLIIKRCELSRLIKSGKWVAYQVDLSARRALGQKIIINRI